MAKIWTIFSMLSKCSVRILLLSVALCWQISWADPAKKFADVLLSLQTMEGRFAQKILDIDGVELQATEGTFKVKRPGYFWWHVSPPFEQVVLGTPDALKVYDPDLEQMTVHSQDSYSATPAWLISGDVDKISQRYDVEEKKQNNTTTFMLKQKTEVGQQTSFKSLSFSFVNQNKSMWLNEMIFVDKLDQTTQVTVTDLQLNHQFSKNAFLFEPPEGTDIIVDG